MVKLSSFFLDNVDKTIAAVIRFFRTINRWEDYFKIVTTIPTGNGIKTGVYKSLPLRGY